GGKTPAAHVKVEGSLDAFFHGVADDDLVAPVIPGSVAEDLFPGGSRQLFAMDLYLLFHRLETVAAFCVPPVHALPGDPVNLRHQAGGLDGLAFPVQNHITGGVVLANLAVPLAERLDPDIPAVGVEVHAPVGADRPAALLADGGLEDGVDDG